LECLRLRVKDIDLDRHEITVREGKGNKDRRTMLPTSIVPRRIAHLVALLLVIENAAAPLNVEVTASVHGLRWTATGADGKTQERAPTIKVASGDDYPWDTVVVLALWAWCAVQVVRDRRAPAERLPS
jgi:integrase